MPEHLLQQTKQEVFEALALEYFDALYNVAVYLTRDPDEARDLVQETYCKAYRFFHRFEPGTNMKAWLFTILRNTYINMCRRAYRHHEQVDFAQIESVYADPSVASDWTDYAAVETLLHHSVHDEVKHALDALPEEFRLVVLLADLEGFSYKEIAEMVGCPEGTVMSRLFRGRQRLQKRLAKFAKQSGYITTFHDNKPPEFAMMREPTCASCA